MKGRGGEFWPREPTASLHCLCIILSVNDIVWELFCAFNLCKCTFYQAFCICMLCSYIACAFFDGALLHAFGVHASATLCCIILGC